MLNVNPKIYFLYPVLIISKAPSLLKAASNYEIWSERRDGTSLLLHNQLKDASAPESQGKMCGPHKVTRGFISV